VNHSNCLLTQLSWLPVAKGFKELFWQQKLKSHPATTVITSVRDDSSNKILLLTISTSSSSGRHSETQSQSVNKIIFFGKCSKNK
jgi:hypothetical protein